MGIFDVAGGKLYSLPVSKVPLLTDQGAVVEADVAATEAEKTKGDTSLPDPTAAARSLGAILGVLAVGVAILINEADLTVAPFDPAAVEAANFALFAGFYVAALIIERAAEIVSPLMPPWEAPTNAPPAPNTTTPGPALDADARAAHTKADRAMIMLGICFLLAVVLSGLLGLYFMTAIGMKVSNTVDIVLTGLVIAGGTKKLHDFISLVQNKNNPTTGTGAG